MPTEKVGIFYIKSISLLLNQTHKVLQSLVSPMFVPNTYVIGWSTSSCLTVREMVESGGKCGELENPYPLGRRQCGQMSRFLQ